MDIAEHPLLPDQWQRVQAAIGELRPDQLLWLSGYLAGRATGGAPVTAAAAAPTGPAVTILFGSQTGNGEELARQLAARAQERGVPADLKNMADYNKSALKKEKLLLLIVSTHGEGDPPDTAQELHEFIYSKRAPDLSGLRFAVLALGDTSYEHFCKTGRDFDERLQALGAVRLHDRKDCDVDYEADAAEWMEGVLAALGPLLQSAPGAPAVSAPTPAATKPAWSKQNPFMAPLLECVNLNGRGSGKTTFHIECSLEGSGLQYTPGDALGILPQNRPDLVFALIEALDADPDTPVQTAAGEQPLHEALSRQYDITTLTRPVLTKYAAHHPSSELQQLLADDHHKQLIEWCAGRDVLDLLRYWPVKGLTAQQLVNLLRKLPPRLYSIASSLEAHPDEVHITVAVVNYHSHGRERSGVCSNYLADLDEDASIPVYIHENRNFRLPADPAVPVIMIGPGTGVAPFRAFIEERAAHGATGPNWLFYGDRHFTTDFMYQAELLKYRRDGILTRLSVAFSRDQAEKRYVQHVMREEARELYRWIEEGAHIYVCGDAEQMAPSVHQTLIQIIADQGGQDEAAAEAYLKQCIKSKRYQRDTY